MKSSVVGGVEGENFKLSDPVEGELCLEHGCVGISLGTLVGGGRGVADPCPATPDERSGRAKGVHDGSAVFHYS